MPWYLGMVTLVACASPGAAVFAVHPELRPGGTTWEAVRRRHQRGPVALRTQEDFLARVVTSSPRVLAAWEAWSSQTEASGRAAALPWPFLKYTAPFSLGGDGGPLLHLVELEQVIPSPVSLAARGEVARARVDEGRHRYETTVLEVATELVGLLAEVRYLQQALLAVAENESLAEQLAAAADGRLGRDAGTLFDVTRARSQLARLRYDRIRLEELLVATSGKVNALVDLPPNNAFGPLAPWPLSPEAPAVEPLYARALEREPGLKAVDAAITGKMAEVAEAQGQWWPELMVGLMWRRSAEDVEGERPDDELGVMVGVSLPLWRRADSATVDEAEAMLAGKVFEKGAMVQSLLAEVQEAWLAGRNARRLLALHDETLLPEARRAMADADAWQKSRSAGFTDFLEARMALYQFTLARERAYADAVQAEARLGRLVGGTTGGAR